MFDEDASCSQRLEQALGDVAFWLDAAAVTYRRAARIGRGGGRAERQPVPFDPRVRPAVRELERCVRGVASFAPNFADFDSWSTVRVATYLTTQPSLLRRMVSEPQTYWCRSLLKAVDRLAALVDLPAERWYAGQCSRLLDDGTLCPVDLYAAAQDLGMNCPGCGFWHSTTARRRFMLEAAEEVIATAADISRALTSWDDPVTPERIRQWAHRNQLFARSVDPRGHPKYLVRDVRGLLRAAELRRHQVATRQNAAR